MSSPTQKDFSGIFSAFSHEFSQWSKGEKIPYDADLNMKYNMELQQKRLQKYGVERSVDLISCGSPISLHKVNSRNPLLKNTFLTHYTHSVYGQHIQRNVQYRLNGKDILSRKIPSFFYQSILDLDLEGGEVQSVPYVCPGCGALAPVDQLASTGCPYCGAHFLTTDLYPKVCNYFFIDSIPFTPEQVRKELHALPRPALIISCVTTLLSLLALAGRENSIFSFLLSLVFIFAATFLFSLAVLYVGFTGLQLLRLFSKAWESIKVVIGGIRARSRLTEKLRTYDPSFNYEYFEGKAMSLVRTILFQDDLAECVQYEGPDISERFSHILDAQYRGGMKFRKIRKEGSQIQVILDLFLSMTELHENQIRIKKKRMRLTMRHSADFPVNTSFSITKVQCPCCSGSFDARVRRSCPYCGNAYDAGIRDWVVTDLK